MVREPDTRSCERQSESGDNIAEGRGHNYDVWSSSRGEPNPGAAAGRRRTQTEVSLPVAAKGERDGKATDIPGRCPLKGCSVHSKIIVFKSAQLYGLLQLLAG
jgi:hypothetical protein